MDNDSDYSEQRFAAVQSLLQSHHHIQPEMTPYGIQIRATKHITQGQLVLRCTGTGTVVLRKHEPTTCSECFRIAKNIRRMPIQCNTCKMAFCSDHCHIKHDQTLCAAFNALEKHVTCKSKAMEKQSRRNKINHTTDDLQLVDWQEVINDARMIIRILLSPHQEMQLLTTLLCSNFDSHPPEISALADAVVEATQASLPMDYIKPISAEFLKRLVYQTYCNRFSFLDSSLEQFAMSVFIAGSFFNHSCYPNVSRVVLQTDILFYACRPIYQGEYVYYSYEDISLGHERRRKLLTLNYYFNCQCPRCQLEQDSAEVEEFVASRLCKGCDRPFIEVYLEDLDSQSRVGCFCNELSINSI